MWTRLLASYLFYTCGWTQASTSRASATRDPITLFCLVCGDRLENAFEVDIDASRSISKLKDTIKEKNTPEFDNVTAKNLVLWRVNIATREKTKFELLKSSEADIEKDLGGVKIKDPTADIGEEFGALPPKKHIHVIIARPLRK